MQRAASRHFSMVRDFHLADFFTLGNAACGVGAIFFAMLYMASQLPLSMVWRLLRTLVSPSSPSRSTLALAWNSFEPMTGTLLGIDLLFQTCLPRTAQPSTRWPRYPVAQAVPHAAVRARTPPRC